MEKSYSVNNQIKAKIVNLVLSDGEMKESIPLSQALEIAENEGLDIVEMSKQGQGGIPVCKILDYGKMMYQQSKKKKSNKQIKHIKEIKYSLNIDPHDLGTKHKQILKFLSKNYIVRCVLELSGREKFMIDDAVKKINMNLEEFKESATWKEPQISKGRRISVSTTLFPI